MSDETEDKPARTPHIEDINAPQIYADSLWGAGLMGGDNVTLTFGAKIMDHNQSPPATVTKTVLRLVIPRSDLVASATWLAKWLESIASGQAAPASDRSKLN